MNKIFLIFLVLTVNTVTFAEEKGRIHFLRDSGFQGGAVPFSVFIDGEIVCRLSNKRFSIHEVEPGPHEIFVQYYGKKQKEKKKVIPQTITVGAGLDHYVHVDQKMGFFISRATFQEVTKGSAEIILQKLKGQDEDCE